MKYNIIGDVYRLYDVNKVDFIDKPAYLLGVYYDGTLGKAVIEFLDEKGEKILFLTDPTGHKPYFLTNEPPEKIKENKKIVEHHSFDGIEVVTKIDPFTFKELRLTKIITKDPLAVAKLRELVPKAWEAKIKYHDNYIYDNALIPGMKYKLVRHGTKFNYKLITPKISSDIINKVKEILRAEQAETKKLAEEWIPLFEEKPPKAKRIAIDIEVYTPFKGRVPNPSLAEYPIISIALVGTDNYRRVLVLARETMWGELSEEYPHNAEIEIFDSEEALILEAIRVMTKYPIVVTFNGDNFDLPYIFHRALRIGIPKEYLPIHFGEDIVRLETSIHIDLYKFFKNRAIKSYAFGGKYQEENLDAIATALLGISKIGVEGNIGELSLANLVAYNYRDAEITLMLTLFNNELVWRLMILLARIAKVSIEDICRKSISKWIQNLFYWIHRKLNYLIPEPEDIRKYGKPSTTQATIEGKKYAGALVIEPPKGVFFKVTVLDVASLYPSIIKKYNLSYETVDKPNCKSKIDILDETGKKIHHVCIDKPGLSAQITGLIRDFRVGIYKKKAKSKEIPIEMRAWYDVVQKAMKVFINASYGVFGAENFPLYSPAVAESVTALGRKSLYSILKKSAEIGMKVVYGDTDSIFLWAPTNEQLTKLQEWVSKNLGLEIEVDKEFVYVLFTGLKKNYIGRYVNGGIEIKGLMAKKRNTPEFLKQLFIELIEKLKAMSTPEDFKEFQEWLENEVKRLYRELKKKEITLDQLAFKVGLTKSLNEYTKNKPPHVKAALQLKTYGYTVEEGDIITFVKIKGREGYKAIQLAKLYEVDPDKYIEIINSALSQLLEALGVEWSDIVGGTTLGELLIS
ncbi:replicative DNA polymerase I [Staphylothermus marinus F1]|uniref:DNA polymerase n=1 Tax=Staphylothermus marinus (strain ATCC 43588 / DSM 3639 / JCM 9404 / F1) TaxID=399550 RepID=A3DMW2_STAMF|nr:DNA-directed DNA polymerase I [Staphylothermus marinus]ABN69972.1 replicative DNA polymerase I [Staphylothermus marinus F1]